MTIYLILSFFCEGEIILGGCEIDDENSYFYCKNCNEEFDMWPYELNIDCEKYTAVYEHISKNIHEINSFLWDEENLPVPTEK